MFCSYLCCFSTFCAWCVGGFYTCCISTYVYTPLCVSFKLCHHFYRFFILLLQHISVAFSPFSSPHMSKHPSYDPLGYKALKNAAICFQRGVGGKEVSDCTQHLGFLGFPVPFAWVICDTASANTWLVVLWQLFASQAQSLLLMTTVAMPVFSKKNETVSATWPLLSFPLAEV